MKPPGTLTICPAGASPEIRVHDRVEHVLFSFDDALFERVAAEVAPRSASGPCFQPVCRNASIAGIMLLLIEEVESGNPSGRIYLESLAHAVVTRYLLVDGRSAADARHGVEGGVSALPARLLAKVRQKIEADLQADLSLNCLAKEAGYSREHFLRMFRAATGLTPHQYIVDLRLQQCKDQLQRKNSSIIDIAALCGFSSQSHMTSAFRKKFGVTPAHFRRSAPQ